MAAGSAAGVKPAGRLWVMFTYSSTGAGDDRVGFGEAMLRGLAPDGGLYVPDALPVVDLDEVRGAGDLAALAEGIIRPYLVGDSLAEHLAEICRDVFQIPIPVTELFGGHLALELFHGPTAAFKDFGAGFLAHCLSHSAGRRRIIVATSGDTGGAVAAACHGRAELDVLILYPKGGVSSCQEQQLTCWGGNVRALAVDGSFDECQRLVKLALAENPWPDVPLTTANSISIGRLVPQIVHHAVGAMAAFEAHGRAVDFLIPSGNLGNATAALWAKRMGFPIRRLILVSNANRVLPDFMESGVFEARKSLGTLANAMDIGNPSNLVRVRHAYSNHAELTDEVLATSVSDAEIRTAIQACYRETGRMLDPHTATAFAALGRFDSAPKLIVSTAHPAKFPEVVEPLLGCAVPLPPSLESLRGRASHFTEVEPTLAAIQGVF
jgi:threonine synthase